MERKRNIEYNAAEETKRNTCTLPPLSPSSLLFLLFHFRCCWKWIYNRIMRINLCLVFHMEFRLCILFGFVCCKMFIFNRTYRRSLHVFSTIQCDCLMQLFQLSFSVVHSPMAVCRIWSQTMLKFQLRLCAHCSNFICLSPSLVLRLLLRSPVFCR